VALALLPPAAQAVARDRALTIAVAEALAEADPEDLDAVDAAWYLLAAASTLGGEAGAEGAAGGAWLRVAQLLPRCPLPPSAERYAGLVRRRCEGGAA
jgi:hypothetical protein